jgi:hypothetical protein
MFELKPLSQQAIPDALKKAERYRFLNEPRQAESICRDILNVDAEGFGSCTKYLRLRSRVPGRDQR